MTKKKKIQNGTKQKPQDKKTKYKKQIKTKPKTKTKSKQNNRDTTNFYFSNPPSDQKHNYLRFFLSKKKINTPNTRISRNFAPDFTS